MPRNDREHTGRGRRRRRHALLHGPLGVALGYAIVTGPQHGTLGAINQTNGQVSYTSHNGYAGTDTFTYRATNAGGSSNTATATITVPPPVLPKTSAKVVAVFRLFHRYTTVVGLTVTHLPRGATVDVLCHGRACSPQRIHKRYAHGADRASLGSQLKHRKLRKGARLEVRVTARGTIGIVKRYTMRPPTFPSERSLCLTPGATAPARC